jgi:predicted kinase
LARFLNRTEVETRRCVRASAESPATAGFRLNRGAPPAAIACTAMARKVTGLVHADVSDSTFIQR